MKMDLVEEKKQEILVFLAQKLAVLAEAAGALVKGVGKIAPRVSVPRPRFFELCPGIVWPRTWKDEGGLQPNSGPQEGKLRVDYDGIVIEGKGFRYLYSPSSREEIAQRICDFCNWQPRKIAHAVRQIDAAIHWARDRHAGLLRAAEEIVKQQTKWQEELQTAIAVAKLGGGG